MTEFDELAIVFCESFDVETESYKAFVEKFNLSPVQCCALSRLRQLIKETEKLTREIYKAGHTLDEAFERCETLKQEKKVCAKR